MADFRQIKKKINKVTANTEQIKKKLCYIPNKQRTNTTTVVNKNENKHEFLLVDPGAQSNVIGGSKIMRVYFIFVDHCKILQSSFKKVPNLTKIGLLSNARSSVSTILMRRR